MPDYYVTTCTDPTIKLFVYVYTENCKEVIESEYYESI